MPWVRIDDSFHSHRPVHPRADLCGAPYDRWARARSVRAGPVAVTTTFGFCRPKSHYGTGRNSSVLKPSAPRWPTSKRDLDKPCRAVLDGLTGALIADDGQVVALRAVKYWTATEGVWIRVEDWAAFERMGAA